MLIDDLIKFTKKQVLGNTPITDGEENDIYDFALKSINDVYKETVMLTDAFNRIAYADISFDNFNIQNQEKDTDGRTYFLPVCVNTDDKNVKSFFKINYVYLDDIKLFPISINTALRTLEPGKIYSTNTTLGYVVLEPHLILVKMPQPKDDETKRLLVSFVPTYDFASISKEKHEVKNYLTSFTKLYPANNTYTDLFDSNIIPLPIEFEPVIEKRLIYYLTKLFPTLDQNASIKAEADYIQSLNNLKSGLLMEKQLKTGWKKNQYGELSSSAEEREQEEVKRYNINKDTTFFGMSNIKMQEYVNAVSEAKQNYLNLLDELRRKYL